MTFAFAGEEPLRHIPTPEEAGVPRAWLGIVDPVLDCNGWMLDEATLLPKFKFGDPDPQDELDPPWQRGLPTSAITSTSTAGRVYRPHQYVALADEHAFTEAKTDEKPALPVCEFGPRHRFFERCEFLAHSVENLAEALKTIDEGHGAIAAQVREMAYEEECLGSEGETRSPLDVHRYTQRPSLAGKNDCAAPAAADSQTARRLGESAAPAEPRQKPVSALDTRHTRERVGPRATAGAGGDGLRQGSSGEAAKR